MRRAALVLAILMAPACSPAVPSPAPTPPPARTSASPLGSEPIRSGDFTGCPAGTVGVAGPFVYPPGYPLDHLPALERCLPSLAKARAAGYRRAPPPPGFALVGPIFLGPTDRSLVMRCRRGAERVGIPVACPRILPGSGEGVWGGGGTRHEFLLEGSFTAPASYVGAGVVGLAGSEHAVGHLWVGSLPGTSVLPRQLCSRPTAERTLVRGRAARLIACKPGAESHGGHLVLVWEEQGATHLVSLHAHNEVNRRATRLIAERVRLIG